jgi:hypothetical protein
MLGVLSTLVAAVSSAFKTRAALQLENLALRHQIGVLQRSAKKRPKLTAADRFFWAWLCTLWGDWRSALVIVKPGTVIRLAPQGLPVVLDLEGPARATGTARDSERGSRSAR